MDRRAINWGAIVAILHSALACSDDPPNRPGVDDRVHVVPAEYPTIGDAIEASVDGDTVRIEAGLYEGPGNVGLVIDGKSIAIIGAGRDSVIIDGGGADGDWNGWLRLARTGYGTVVEGITVRNAFTTGSGGAIEWSGGEVRVAGCRFKNCRAERGGALYIGEGSGSLSRTEFIDCAAEKRGGAIFLGYSLIYLGDVTCLKNRAELGAGMFLERTTIWGGDQIELIGNIANGSNGGDGGGMFVQESTADLMNVEIIGNEAGISGGGVFLARQAAIRFRGATIADNWGHYLGGGIYIRPGSGADLHNTIVYGNCDTANTGELYVEAGAGVSFFCCAVDSAGVNGGGSVRWSGDQVFADPQFCEPSGCGEGGVGSYGLKASSPCNPSRSPCRTMIGALLSGCPVASTRSRW